MGISRLRHSRLVKVRGCSLSRILHTTNHDTDRDSCIADGSAAPSSPSSTTRLAPTADPPPHSRAKCPPPTTNWPVAAARWKHINALKAGADASSDSPAMARSGRCWKHDGAVSANGRIASPCSAAPLGVGCAGFGAQKIMSGRKYTRIISADGSTLMRVKRRGITRGCTRKVRFPSTHPLPFQCLPNINVAFWC